MGLYEMCRQCKITLGLCYVNGVHTETSFERGFTSAHSIQHYDGGCDGGCHSLLEAFPKQGCRSFCVTNPLRLS
jgi:hypothetical protein